jgi:anti-sigma B factor antagonist
VVDPGVQEHDFRLHVERGVTDDAVISVAGDVDLHSAPELRDQLAGLAADAAPRVVVDLSRATFLDSSGMRVLVGARRSMPEARIDLVATDAGILRALEIARLDTMFPVHSSLESVPGD